VIVHETHLCVQQLYGQYKHAIIHDPHLCVQQLHGQYKHTIVHEPHLCVQQLHGQYKHVIVSCCAHRCVYALSCVCTDYAVVVHTGVVHGLSCVSTNHTVVIHQGVVHGVSQQLYGQYKHTVVHNCLISTNTR
jgi:hypothetical protein